MKKRELPQAGMEQKPEELSGKEKFEVILKLFGSETARHAFIETCKQYVALRTFSSESALEEGQGDERDKYTLSPKRAILHNRIMETLKHLSLGRLDPLSEKVLHEMASREITKQIVKEWVLAHENAVDEDEDIKATEEIRKKNDMSGPSYFHSLGKEH